MILLRQKELQPLDAMVEAMPVGHTYLVRLFPKEINDADRAALFVHPENRAKPTLAVDGFVLQAQLHSISTGLNAEVWNVRIKSQPSRQRDSLPKLAGSQRLLRLALYTGEREYSKCYF